MDEIFEDYQAIYDKTVEMQGNKESGKKKMVETECDRGLCLWLFSLEKMKNKYLLNHI